MSRKRSCIANPRSGMAMAGLCCLLLALAATADERSPVGAARPSFYGVPELPLRFSHARHLQSGEIGCDRCHAEAALSASAADRLLPGERVCAGCHDQTRKQPGETLTERCLYCHTGVTPGQDVLPRRVVYPAAKLTFSHKIHSEVAGLACVRCHDGQHLADAAGAGVLPAEDLCLRCHADGEAAGGCRRCHPTDAAGRLEGSLKPRRGALDHHDRWSLRHGQAARYNEESCRQCHLPDRCLRCHGGLRKPEAIHPADYRLVHGAEARSRPQRCQSCHTESRDCRACHQRLGVASGALHGQKRAQTHPSGWGSCYLSGTHHAYQAKRNLMSCATCHQEKECVACHKPSGSCGNILSVHRHLSRSQLESLKEKNRRACAKCHGSAAP